MTSNWKPLPLVVAVLLLLLLTDGTAALDNGLGRLPVRGVSSWCVQGRCGWDRCWEAQYEALADAMVAEGLREANYSYLIIDDCWVAGRNVTTGQLYADPTRFPRGISHIASYVHARGLRLGLYTDVTHNPCQHGQYERESGRVPGSLGHYELDAKTFASWGVDYVKADFCNGSHHVGSGADQKLIFTVDPKEAYTNFSRALNSTGRPMYFIACFDRWLPKWGSSGEPVYPPPWEWIHPIANAYRLSNDHHDNWPELAVEIETNSQAASYSIPGAFGDWDYLTTGGQGCVGAGPPPAVGPAGGGAPGIRCPNMTQAEYQTAFSMWVMGASPLIIDADIRNLSAFQRATLLHDEVLSLHHDELAAGGSRIGCVDSTAIPAQACAAQVWAKPLAGNRSLIALLNLGDSPRTIRLPFDLLGYNRHIRSQMVQNSTAAPQWLSLRDVWRRKELGSFTGFFTTSAPVQAHGTLLLLIQTTTPPHRSMQNKELESQN